MLGLGLGHPTWVRQDGPKVVGVPLVRTDEKPRRFAMRHKSGCRVALGTSLLMFLSLNGSQTVLRGDALGPLLPNDLVIRTGQSTAR